MSEPSEPTIEFSGATVSFGGTEVLRDLDLFVRPGETLVLIGRSGSGKSTALRLVNALLHPAAGSVLVRGRATTDWDPIALRRGIGYMIQEVGLFPHFTVAQNAGLVPELLGWSEDRIDRRVGELLELVSLPPGTYASRYPNELSGGQRQRVGVARALAADPDILLCDEPFGSLDPITRGELQREFREIGRRSERTQLFVTHDLSEALYIGDRIALLHEGRLRFVGTPADLRSSRDALVRGFLEAASVPEGAAGEAG